jgi:acyl carrier protein
MDDAKKMIIDYVKKEFVDSFSMVSLKTFLEKKFKIQIPDAKATPEAFDSVNNIITLLKEFVKM